MILPYTISWAHVKFRHIYCDDEIYPKEESLDDIYNAYFCLGDYDRVLQKDFKRIIIQYENLPEIIIFFYENFERGDSLTPLKMLQNIYSFYNFTRIMGEIIGEKFYSEIKQLRNDEEADENF